MILNYITIGTAFLTIPSNTLFITVLPRSQYEKDLLTLKNDLDQNQIDSDILIQKYCSLIKNHFFASSYYFKRYLASLDPNKIQEKDEAYLNQSKEIVKWELISYQPMRYLDFHQRIIAGLAFYFSFNSARSLSIRYKWIDKLFIPLLLLNLCSFAIKLARYEHPGTSLDRWFAEYKSTNNRYR